MTTARARARLLALSAVVVAACDNSSAVSGPAAGADAADAIDVVDASPGREEVGPARDAAILVPDVAADAAVDAGPPRAPGPATVVRVTIDGAPAVDVLVVQGGGDVWARTDVTGVASLILDPEIEGDLAVLASHPEARIRAALVWPDDFGPYEIPLIRYDTSDNLEYVFQDPGEPDRRATTDQCAHCHVRTNEDWAGSVHRNAARNPTVQDLFTGGAAALDSAERCAAAGGRWRVGRWPGGRPEDRGTHCYIGDGVLSALDPSCEEAPCEAPASVRTDCADCHAPGLDGALGGRDLRDAVGRAFDYGVHCDVCHRVESVDLDAPAGVAGRLRLLRPSEEASRFLGAGGRLPLTFCPSHDVPNPRMGCVQRDHFRDGTLCAGCHELWTGDGLPIHTTWSEWRASPLADAATCAACHMPPSPLARNAADVDLFPSALVGEQAGWIRPPGGVRHHTWHGPRGPDPRWLELAATLHVTIEREGEPGQPDEPVPTNQIRVAVRTKNVAAGHAIPTGEPMRSVLLRVEAFCGDAMLEPVGGDALPGWAGAADVRSVGEDWTHWPGAHPGDLVRIVARPGEFHDYAAEGPFAADRPAAEKGRPFEHVRGAATVVAVDNERVTFDRSLPEGDVAYRIPAEATGLEALAGAAGFAFARVLVDGSGRQMVPHFLATGVESDLRLRPQVSWTSRHVFSGRCDTPRVRARLVHRPYPRALATQRAWLAYDRVMTEVWR